MVKIYSNVDNGANLVCTDQATYEQLKEFEPINTNYLLCAKHPFHKELVGYEKNCPKEHFEYLYAYRDLDTVLALNMVDVQDKKYFDDKMIDEGIDFIDRSLKSGIDVVVVCNKGESRSPSMCLMYLISQGYFLGTLTFKEVVEEFKKIYPAYKANCGIYEYVCDYWQRSQLTKNK